MTLKKRVLITGVGGYLGSALALSLLSEGHEVIGFGHGNNFSALKEKTGSKIKLIEGDITDYELLFGVARNIDIIIHAAAPTGIKACEADIWGAVRTIVRGTHIITEVALANKVPFLIHLSTQAVYSTFKQRKMPLVEDAELFPDEIYGALKAEAEEYVKQTPAIILRLTNVFGRGAGIVFKKDVVGHFVNAAKNRKELKIFGDGGQGVDFIHIDDVSRTVAGIVDIPLKKLPPALNVGFGSATSIKTLAEIVARAAKDILGRDVNIIFESAPAGKVWPDRWVDNAKIKKNISLVP